MTEWPGVRHWCWCAQERGREATDGGGGGGGREEEEEEEEEKEEEKEKRQEEEEQWGCGGGVQAIKSEQIIRYLHNLDLNSWNEYEKDI